MNGWDAFEIVKETLSAAPLHALPESQRRALAGAIAQALGLAPATAEAILWRRGFFLDVCSRKLHLKQDAAYGLLPLLELSVAISDGACPFLEQLAADASQRERLLARLVCEYVGDRCYDSRVREGVRRTAHVLGVPWVRMGRIEDALVQFLRAAAMEQARALHATEGGPNPKKKWSPWRWAAVGAAAAAGAGLMVVTGGLAAPALLAGFAAVGTAVGLGAAASVAVAFFSSAGGAALVLTIFGVAGGGLASYRMARRTAGVSTFWFESLVAPVAPPAGPDTDSKRISGAQVSHIPPPWREASCEGTPAKVAPAEHETVSSPVSAACPDVFTTGSMPLSTETDNCPNTTKLKASTDLPSRNKRGFWSFLSTGKRDAAPLVPPVLPLPPPRSPEHFSGLSTPKYPGHKMSGMQLEDARVLEGTLAVAQAVESAPDTDYLRAVKTAEDAAAVEAGGDAARCVVAGLHVFILVSGVMVEDDTVRTPGPTATVVSTGQESEAEKGLVRPSAVFSDFAVPWGGFNDPTAPFVQQGQELTAITVTSPLTRALGSQSSQAAIAKVTVDSAVMAPVETSTAAGVPSTTLAVEEDALDVSPLEGTYTAPLRGRLCLLRPSGPGDEASILNWVTSSDGATNFFPTTIEDTLNTGSARLSTCLVAGGVTWPMHCFDGSAASPSAGRIFIITVPVQVRNNAEASYVSSTTDLPAGTGVQFHEVGFVAYMPIFLRREEHSGHSDKSFSAGKISILKAGLETGTASRLPPVVDGCASAAPDYYELRIVIGSSSLWERQLGRDALRALLLHMSLALPGTGPACELSLPESVDLDAFDCHGETKGLPPGRPSAASSGGAGAPRFLFIAPAGCGLGARVAELAGLVVRDTVGWPSAPPDHVFALNTLPRTRDLARGRAVLLTGGPAQVFAALEHELMAENATADSAPRGGGLPLPSALMSSVGASSLFAPETVYSALAQAWLSAPELQVRVSERDASAEPLAGSLAVGTSDQDAAKTDTTVSITIARTAKSEKAPSVTGWLLRGILSGRKAPSSSSVPFTGAYAVGEDAPYVSSASAAARTPELAPLMPGRFFAIPVPGDLGSSSASPVAVWAAASTAKVDSAQRAAASTSAPSAAAAAGSALQSGLKVTVRTANRIGVLGVSAIASQRGWWRSRMPYGDPYTLIYEPASLRALGATLTAFVRQYLSGQAVSQVLAQTALSSLLAAWSLPSYVTAALTLIDAPWTVAVNRADRSGEMLAEALIEGAHGMRPVSLVGYGLGARVVFSAARSIARAAALEAARRDALRRTEMEATALAYASGGTSGTVVASLSGAAAGATGGAVTSLGSAASAPLWRFTLPADVLAREAEGASAAPASAGKGTDGPPATTAAAAAAAAAASQGERPNLLGILHDVIMLGAPVTANPDSWAAVRGVASGRVVNGYCAGDFVLKFVYRSYELSWVVAGLGPVGFSGARAAQGGRGEGGAEVSAAGASDTQKKPPLAQTTHDDALLTSDAYATDAFSAPMQDSAGRTSAIRRHSDATAWVSSSTLPSVASHPVSPAFPPALPGAPEPGGMSVSSARGASSEAAAEARCSSSSEVTLANRTAWHEGIESVDLSHIVTGHVDYRSKLEAVMDFLAFES